jgi:hypothetical protein
MTASVPMRVSVMQAPLDIAGGSIYDNALETIRAYPVLLRPLSSPSLPGRREWRRWALVQAPCQPLSTAPPGWKRRE